MDWQRIKFDLDIYNLQSFEQPQPILQPILQQNMQQSP